MNQHSLIAYRSDSSMEAPAFEFTDERSRDYIPIRLPWALTIRERLPPGSVAVVLNPAHVHHDLVLPVNAAQDRVLGQIAGQRTLGEIVSDLGSGEEAYRALQFVEQLWWYDQIVFDASNSVTSK
jgi:hypothetical protein